MCERKSTRRCSIGPNDWVLPSTAQHSTTQHNTASSLVMMRSEDVTTDATCVMPKRECSKSINAPSICAVVDDGDARVKGVDTKDSNLSIILSSFRFRAQQVQCEGNY